MDVTRIVRIIWNYFWHDGFCSSHGFSIDNPPCEKINLLTYKSSPSGSLFNARTGDLVTLNQIRNQIVDGDSVQVLKSHTNEDVTLDILLKVICLESDDEGTAPDLNDELEALIRRERRKRAKNRISDNPMLREDRVLAGFMRLQIAYTKVWVRDFGRRYLSVEYILLVTNTFMYHWSRKPFGVGTATQTMRHGSRKTRKKRLLFLFENGWLRRVRDRIDRRRVAIAPTPEFEELVRNHFIRTLTSALMALPDFLGLEHKASTIIAKLQDGNREAVNLRYLVPYLEYLMWALESWDTILYGYEFFEIEILEVCSHVVISHLIDKPLTGEKLRELSPHLSSRVLQTRINQCIKSKLIVKSKHPEDKRVGVLSPTPLLTSHFTAHYSLLFSRFVRVVERLP